MAESALPHPTKNRLAFADEVAAARIRWYNFDTPQAFHTVTGFKHTAALDELVAAGLATVPPCAAGSSSVAELTPDGMAWVTRARTRENVAQALESSPELRSAATELMNTLDAAIAGPGSTSPEPGSIEEPDGPDGVCAAHGPHPHTDRPQGNGPGSCLDCPTCAELRAGHSTEDGAAT